MGKISPNFRYHKVEKQNPCWCTKIYWKRKEMKWKDKSGFFCLSSHTGATWARSAGRGSIISLGLGSGSEFRLGGWGRRSRYIMYIDRTVRSVREMEAESYGIGLQSTVSASLTRLLGHSGSFALWFFEQQRPQRLGTMVSICSIYSLPCLNAHALFSRKN